MSKCTSNNKRAEEHGKALDLLTKTIVAELKLGHDDVVGDLLGNFEASASRFKAEALDAARHHKQHVKNLNKEKGDDDGSPRFRF